jgi:hypothetical protein
VFFAIGAGFLVFGIIPNLYDWTRMQQWVAVPAELDEIELKSSRSDNTTSYRVAAQYRYAYGNQWYINDRIGISGGSDNIGSWQQDTYRAMHHRPLMVWVNTEDPRESIYDRDLRWGLIGFKSIFVITFGGFGAVVLWFVTRKKQRLPPGLPYWRANTKWSKNKIQSNTQLTMWAGWVFAILWNAISSPILFVVPGEVIDKGNYPALLGLLFPLVGAGALFFAARQTLGWKKFGKTLLSMDPFPGNVGETIGGYVELRLPFNPNYRFQAILNCINVYTSRSGNKSETRRRILWQDEQAASIETGMRGTRVRFAFDTPTGLPPSSEPSDNYHVWSLKLQGDLPGVDFYRSFELPVTVSDRPRKKSPEEEKQQRATATSSNPITLPAKLVRLRDAGGGLELFYPLFRQISAGLIALAVGGIFVGFAILFMHFSKNRVDWLLYIFVTVGALIVVSGIYLLSNTLTVHLNTRGLTTTRRILGIPFSRYSSLEDIVRIDKGRGMQVGERIYYRLYAKTKAGKRLWLGDSLPNASTADYLLNRLRQLIGQDNDSDDQAPIQENGQNKPQLMEQAKGIKQVIKIAAILIAFSLFGSFLFGFWLSLSK